LLAARSPLGKPVLLAAEQIVCLVARLFGADRLFDHAIGADDKSKATGQAIFDRVHRAKSQTQFALGVAEQRKGELLLLLERTVGFGGADGCAVNRNAGGFKVLDSITESIALLRSSGGAGNRVEPQHHALADEVGLGHGFAVAIQHAEIWAKIAGLQHGWGAFQQASKQSADHGG
jgi:hypothetical protein